MTRKVKSEMRAPQNTCVLTAQVHRWSQCSKPILCAIGLGLIRIIADFAVKPFSSKHLGKHVKWLKLFSTLSGLVFTFWMKIGRPKKRLGHKNKDLLSFQGQGLEIGPEGVLEDRQGLPTRNMIDRRTFRSRLYANDHDRRTILWRSSSDRSLIVRWSSAT